MRTETRARRPAGNRRDQRGIALVIALFALTVFAVAAATGFLIGGSDIRATRNYRGATQVHFVAESGISHAVQVINGPGVVNYKADVVDNWANLWTPNQRTFTALPGGFTYTVTTTQNAADPVNLGRIISVADGPEGAHNVVVANILRSNIPSTAPGAIYLATDQQTNSTFNGNNFRIDGNDHNYTGGMGPGAPIPGISTRNDGNTQEAITSLNGSNDDNVTGLGFQTGPPTVPSVKTSPAAPTVTQLNQMVNDLLALPGVHNFNGDTLNNSTSIPGWQAGNGPAPYPTITHFTSSTGVRLQAGGNVTGQGILIVDGDLSIQGNLTFDGLIIVRGKATVGDPNDETNLQGSAVIYGSIWSDDVKLTVGGHADIYYSTQALALANQVTNPRSLPAPISVTSLIDCSQVPSGTNGCPAG